MKYKFYDTDKFGINEYDISGNEYVELIHTCCKYCKTMSLRAACDNVSHLRELSNYRTNDIAFIPDAYRHYDISHNKPENIYYYNVCSELCELMLSISDSIFKWIYGWGYTNPEDPVFYRHDGSVFFSSIIHEGECTLIPRDDEDVNKIISSGNWIKCDK